MPPPPSLHAVGDTALYVFEGSELPSPVTVAYTVTRTDGARVTFEVRVRRNSEERVWRQTLIDTRQNREQLKLEAVEIPTEDGWSVETSPSSSRVADLYAWTMPSAEFLQKGSPFPYSSSGLIGGVAIRTDCVDVDGHYGLKAATFHACTSRDTPWWTVDSRITNQRTDEVLWSARLESMTGLRPPDTLP